MDQNRFERLTKTLTAIPSRRDVLRGLTGLGLGLGVPRIPEVVEAKKKRKHKKRKKKAKPNGFGCLEVGDPCESEEQCCSGICEGKKGKKKCVAHDVAICQVDSDFCSGGQTVLCGTTNLHCACTLTTGNAPFCGDYTGFPGETLCRDCSQDTDCEAEFGPGAACVVYSRLCAEICPDTGTACVPACKNVEL